MVEIFKTNITEECQANQVVELLHLEFPGHKANFDLEDCDNILRVASGSTRIHPDRILSFVRKLGFVLELFPDEPSTVQSDNLLSEAS